MTEAPESKTRSDINDIDLALCRGMLYSALALGFRPPTEESAALLGSKETGTALADAAATLDPIGEWNLAAACSLLTAHSSWFDWAHHDPEPSAELGRTPAEGSLLTLAASYHRLFGHTARGAVPPYETEYGTEALFQQPQEMGDLMGFYRAFGLTLNTREHERPDHISCECEFLSFLALKEAYALEQRDDGMLAETRKAARLFLRDHLARFVPAFAKRLTRIAHPHPRPLAAGEGWGEGEDNRDTLHDDSQSFYGALGDLLLTFVNRECARLDLPLGSVGLELRPATDKGVPMACGSGAECAAMPGEEGGQEL